MPETPQPEVFASPVFALGSPRPERLEVAFASEVEFAQLTEAGLSVSTSIWPHPLPPHDGSVAVSFPFPPFQRNTSMNMTFYSNTGACTHLSRPFSRNLETAIPVVK